ncbi:hypothetical protein [Cohnella abietis]|uniref:Uncharacterized protein n=1 Tax=Cohnella abietis TaxID=2507935 RepID=A0A3T1DAF5_9BACL|nr:hypothetical protein [Cohnella abietis]BBI34958.1 hypothetical protein KCTCHS21_43570 [Cohnella abietis]
MQHYMFLESKLVFIFKQYESLLDNVVEITIYNETCRRNILNYQTQNLLNQFKCVCENVKIKPAFTIKPEDGKLKTALFSVLFNEPQGTLTVSLYITKNQLLFTEYRSIPGITE